MGEVTREALLGRLLGLNHQRHADELRTGQGKRGALRGGRKVKGPGSNASTLFS